MEEENSIMKVLKVITLGVVTGVLSSLLFSSSALAAPTFINLDTQQNTAGISSSAYFTNKFIQINNPTDYASQSLDDIVIGETTVTTSRPFVTQWACPNTTITHFTQCELIITIASPYLSRMVQQQGDANIYSPDYNVNDKINYYLLVNLYPNHLQVKIPLLYSPDGDVLVSRIKWDSIPMNSVFVSNGRCINGSCAVSSTSTLGYNSGGGVAFTDTQFSTVTDSTRIIDQKDQGVLCFNSSGTTCSSGNSQIGMNGYLSSTYLHGSTQTLGDFARTTSKTNFDISIAGYRYSDFYAGNESNFNLLYFWLTGVGLTPPDSLTGAGSVALEPFALETNFNPQVQGGIYRKPLSENIPYNLTSAENVGGCLISSLQPLFVDSSCSSFTSGDVGNDREIFRFSTVNPTSTGQRCHSLQTALYTCSTALAYLLAAGNTTDVEGVNCSVDCDKPLVDDFDYGNDSGVRDPYTNPDDRAQLGDCGIDLFNIPGIDWDCFMEALFSPSLDRLNQSVDNVAPIVEQVFFPFSYGIAGWEAIKPILDKLGSDSCTGFSVPVPSIGDWLLIPCPSDAEIAGTVASYTRALVPWILSTLLGLMFLRNLTRLFGFSGSAGLASTSLPSPDKIEEPQKPEPKSWSITRGAG